MNTKFVKLGSSRMSRRDPNQRKGAVIPLFAILLPVLVMLCAIAINLAYMQLTTTELRIATDASARAGGRAWSEFQTVDDARTFAVAAAAQNTVAGAPLVVSPSDGDGEIEFGLSTRGPDALGRVGYGRYTFNKKNTADVIAGTEEATSVRVNGKRNATLLVGGVGGIKMFKPVISSICTQVDRDISLIVDRSGSMAFHEEWNGDASGQSWNELEAWCQSRMNDYKNNGGHTETYYVNGKKKTRFVWDDPAMQSAYNSMKSYYDDLIKYQDTGGTSRIPSPCRWDSLEAGVNAFLDVLETTDQEEQVSLGSFNSSGTLNLALQSQFGSIRNWVNNTHPYGGTAIHSGMTQSFGALYGSAGRPYAAKTIVVMTDGQNNAGPQAVIDAATNIVASYNITIHTVTYSPGADQNTMATVANIGGGRHYHANDTSGLVAIFEEIANNLPTIITE